LIFVGDLCKIKAYDSCSIFETEVTSVSEGAIEYVIADGEKVESGGCIDMVCDKYVQVNDKNIPEFINRHLSTDRRIFRGKRVRGVRVIVERPGTHSGLSFVWYGLSVVECIYQ